MRTTYSKYTRSQPESRKPVTVQLYKPVSVVRETKWYFWKCNQRLTRGSPSVCFFYATANGQRWHVERQFRSWLAVGFFSLSASLFVQTWHEKNPTACQHRPTERWKSSGKLTLLHFLQYIPYQLQLYASSLCRIRFVLCTYSVGRRSAVLPRRRMMGPRGLRIFLTSALLSRENRLTRLKPVSKWHTLAPTKITLRGA